ncbi:hypothetical protein GYH30_056138 [Glycine max]|uniref:Uncharacterized protein n=1 Tax=Glycine max TaxID=3847 RepID=K7N3Z9_SOYBN|nr:hypothetical protein GYH30_056138 [Glycine max]
MFERASGCKTKLCLVGLLNREIKTAQLQNTLLSWFKIKLANAEEELHTSQISIATTTSIMKQTWLINEYHQLINGNIKPITSRPSRCEVAKHLITNSSK